MLHIFVCWHVVCLLFAVIKKKVVEGWRWVMSAVDWYDRLTQVVVVIKSNWLK